MTHCLDETSHGFEKELDRLKAAVRRQAQDVEDEIARIRDRLDSHQTEIALREMELEMLLESLAQTEKKFETVTRNAMFRKRRVSKSEDQFILRMTELQDCCTETCEEFFLWPTVRDASNDDFTTLKSDVLALRALVVEQSERASKGWRGKLGSPAGRTRKRMNNLIQRMIGLQVQYLGGGDSNAPASGDPEPHSIALSRQLQVQEAIQSLTAAWEDPERVSRLFNGASKGAP